MESRWWEKEIKVEDNRAEFTQIRERGSTWRCVFTEGRNHRRSIDAFQIAGRIGDDNTPRPWSRRQEKDNKIGVKSSSKISKHDYAKGAKRIQKKPEVVDPVAFQAFLDVRVRGKSKIWSNDMSIPPIAEVISKEKVTEKTRKKKVVAPSDDVSDTEYFKSRVKKNLSDSDSDSDEHDDADISGNEDGSRIENLVVLLALGEAKVIAETKNALAKAGVSVTSLENFATGKDKEEKIRSKHILLVKNLSFATSEKELAQMFGKFGNLDKIILPLAKAMALVVFLEPTEARASYDENGIQALLWAPEDILVPKTLSDNKEKKSDVGENVVRRANLEQQFEMDLDITESNVLHIKNLSIKTGDESLKKHLTEPMKHGKILSVKVSSCSLLTT
ncbi:unnamed protein product [Arabis nemorensis]|uniref:RRM domain-containing protein n=1 Tax=Arabis nemorensis TaxID=586526 RepID=A0A565CI42_9BRAS|nr:unnamed protein product [Arabis nemorensis]